MMKGDLPNLYLVGFMGVGKSSVGRRVAEQLKLAFIDSDQAIEEKERKSVSEIFAEQGEGAFRVMEREFVKSGHPDKNCVVACGGGLVLLPGILDMLRVKGIIICLYASEKTILNRTSGNPYRPLLNVENPQQRIRELLKERNPVYTNAGPCIVTDGRGIANVAEHVERIFLREVEDFQSVPKSEGGHS